MSTLLNSLLTTFNKPVGKDLKKPSKLKSLKKQPKPKKTKPQQDPALINQAQETAREIIAFAREEADKIRAQVKHDSEANRQSLQDFQAKLNTQSQDLTTRTSSLDSKE